MEVGVIFQNCMVLYVNVSGNITLN